MDPGRERTENKRRIALAEPADPRFSRRRFLQAAASLAGSSLIPPTQEAEASQRLILPRGTPHSRVVQYRTRKLVNGRAVHRELLAEAFRETLTKTVADAHSPGEAWRALLSPSDVVGIKFNQSAQEELGTTPSMATTIIESLLSAGFARERIVCIEAPEEIQTTFRTTAPLPGYTQSAHDFGSGADQISAVLEQVTALINVPFLKTHNIAGITCALKNLSHGLIKHPARYHANGCSPYIADIVALKPIRSKLRLCVVDALRLVFDKGPSATAETVADEGIILASTDPVAIDAIGLMLINEVRAPRGLKKIVGAPEKLAYLARAHEIGLGIATPYGIDVLKLTL